MNPTSARPGAVIAPRYHGKSHEANINVLVPVATVSVLVEASTGQVIPYLVLKSLVLLANFHTN